MTLSTWLEHLIERAAKPSEGSLTETARPGCLFSCRSHPVFVNFSQPYSRRGSPRPEASVCDGPMGICRRDSVPLNDAVVLPYSPLPAALGDRERPQFTRATSVFVKSWP
jgi:hypothetical protein